MQEKLFPPFPWSTEAYAWLDGLFGLHFGLRENLWGMADFGDEMIEIFEEIDEDVENRYSNQESDESEEILGDLVDKECEENGELHIRGNDSRIEIVRLNGVNKYKHGDNREDDVSSTIIIPDDENGNGREECPKNRHESEDEDDNPECDDIRECLTTMKKADGNERGDREEGIGESDECLCLEDESETLRNFTENNTVFFIDKRKIPFLYRLEIGGDFGPIDEEDITQDHGDQEFGEENPNIFDIFEGSTDDIFDGSRIENTTECLVDPEIDIDRIFEIGDRILHLIGDRRCIMDESFSLFEKMGDECIKQRHYDDDETHIHDGNDDRKRRKCSEEFLGESVFEMSRELSELLVNRFAHIEEEVRKEEGDEEYRQKGLKEVDKQGEKEYREKLLEKIAVKNELEDKWETHKWVRS